jgi:hypothetical protein
MVKRYPGGVEGKAFYEKQAPADRPDWVQTVPVASERRQWIDHTPRTRRRSCGWPRPSPVGRPRGRSRARGVRLRGC